MRRVVTGAFVVSAGVALVALIRWARADKPVSAETSLSELAQALYGTKPWPKGVIYLQIERH